MILRENDLSLHSAHTDLARELAAYYRRNRDFLREFEPQREEDFFTEDHQRHILQEEMEGEARRQTYRFYIRIDERPGEIIGSIGLSNVVWGAFRSAFLGAKLDHRFINRGYITRANALIVDYAFDILGLHRIEANVMPKNLRSLRALEKSGFWQEGFSKHYLNINGVWEDHIHMVRLNEAMHRSQPNA